MSDEESLKLATINKKLEETLKEKVSSWNTQVKDIVSRIDGIDLDSSKHTRLQMDMLILREDLVFEIATYNLKLSTLKSFLRTKKKKAFLDVGQLDFKMKLDYFQDRDIIISANVTEIIRQIDMLSSYQSFMKEAVNTLDKVGYSMKNIIDNRI